MQNAFAGIDVGARSVKVVIIRDGQVAHASALETEEEGAVASEALLAGALETLGLSSEDLSYVVATGVGGGTVRLAHKTRSEQLCHASGAYFLFDTARTVLDIGAGGVRAMRVNSDGKMTDFAVNSKCAAGTGAFIEAMTKIMHVPIQEMGPTAIRAKGTARVGSYCAVFAESEVISSIHQGVPKEDIVAGIHEAVVDKLVETLYRVQVAEDVVATGGVAKNVGIIAALERRLGRAVKVPPDPQIVGALGAAMVAQRINPAAH